MNDTRTFAEFSESIQACVFAARFACEEAKKLASLVRFDACDAQTGDDPFKAKQIASAAILIGQLEELGGHLHPLGIKPQTDIHPHINAINKLRVEREFQSVIINNNRFLSFHEAGISVSRKIYLAAIVRADYEKSARILFQDSTETFSQKDFTSGFADVAISLRKTPALDWDEITDGIRREVILSEMERPVDETYRSAGVLAKEAGVDPKTIRRWMNSAGMKPDLENPASWKDCPELRSAIARRGK